MRAADWIIDIGPGRRRARRPASWPRDRSTTILAAPESLTGQFLSGARAVPVPTERRAGNGKCDPHRRRAREQPEGHHGRDPARATGGDHRRLGLGQVLAGDRTLYKALAQRLLKSREAGRRARPHRGPGAPGQGHRHRPVADRSDAALEPGDVHRAVHADPRAVRPGAGGARARLPARAVLVQRQGRPLRGVRGRRHPEDRDAVPAGRVRAVRGLQGQALQPRDARGQVQGQLHRRRAGDDRRGGAGVLRGHPVDREQAADAVRRRARATSTSASRRRRSRAARRSGSSWRPSSRGARPAGRSTSWTSRRPACTSPTWSTCWRCSAGWSTRATRSW